MKRRGALQQLPWGPPPVQSPPHLEGVVRFTQKSEPPEKLANVAKQLLISRILRLCLGKLLGAFLLCLF